MSKKSALAQALLETDQIVDKMSQKTKAMLYNQVKSELEKTIKEDIDLDDKEDETDDKPIATDDDKTSEEKPADGIVAVDIEKDKEDSPSEDIPLDEPESAETSIEDSSTDDIPSDITTDGDDEEMDLTGVSDDELISIWKKLDDNTDIQVVKNDDNTISVNKDGEEFLIKLNEEIEAPSDDKYSFLNDTENETVKENDDVIIEFVTDDEEQVSQSPEEAPIDEVARTHADGHKMIRKPEGFFRYASSRAHIDQAVNENVTTDNNKVLIKEAEELKTQVTNLLKENKDLKTDLDEHKNALRLMKENLDSVALFNSKLAYVNKLFCEHATTGEEKNAIVDRFDLITEAKEVKTLYKTISSELNSKSITESIEDKLSSKISGTGEPLLENSKIVLSEEEIKINRMKELMGFKHKTGI